MKSNYKAIKIRLQFGYKIRGKSQNTKVKAKKYGYCHQPKKTGFVQSLSFPKR